MDNQLYKLFSTFRRRFTADEKASFLDRAARIFSKHGIPCDLVHSAVLGWHTHSLMVGDIKKAHTVIIANYNTPHSKLLPVPKYIGSFFGNLASWLLPILCICAVSAIIGTLLPYSIISSVIIAAVLMFLAFAAFPAPCSAAASSGALAASMAAKAPDVAVILTDNCFFGLPMHKLFKKIKTPEKVFIKIRYACGSEIAVGSPYPNLFSEAAKSYKRRNTVIDIAPLASLGLVINNIGSPRDTDIDIECAAKAAEAAVSASRIMRELI